MEQFPPLQRFPSLALSQIRFFRSVSLLIVALCAGLNRSELRGQAPVRNASSLEVVATNGAGKEKHLSSLNGTVPMVMVRPNQAVPVTLQFPTDKAGMAVAATPLDGGRINRDNLVILPTGKVIFTFQPGAIAGRYRLMVQTAVEQHLLEFYVVDPNNPPQKRRN